MTKNLKKFGGWLTDWTIHNLTVDDRVQELYDKRGVKPQVMTAVIIEDPIGRWKSGDSMRSSLIVDVDRKAGIVETMNTIYRVDENERPGDDMGNLAAHIYF